MLFFIVASPVQYIHFFTLIASTSAADMLYTIGITSLSYSVLLLVMLCAVWMLIKKSPSSRKCRPASNAAINHFHFFLGDHAAPCCNSSNVHHVLSLSVPGVSPVFNPPYGWWVSHYHRHREHALLTHNTDWCVGASVRENWREKGWFTSTVNFQPCAFWSFFMGIYNYCVITISITVKLMINLNIFQIITNVFDKWINYKSSFCFVIKSI